MQYYKIIISEPWDYVDSKGNNIISGQILNIINEKFLVFQANENIYINGLTSMYFLLSPRYAPFQIRNIPKTLTVNGGVLPQNYSKVSNHEYLFEKINLYLLVNYHAVMSNYNSLLYIFCTHKYISDLGFTILWIYTCIQQS